MAGADTASTVTLDLPGVGRIVWKVDISRQEITLSVWESGTALAKVPHEQVDLEWTLELLPSCSYGDGEMLMDGIARLIGIEVEPDRMIREVGIGDGFTLSSQLHTISVERAQDITRRIQALGVILDG